MTEPLPPQRNLPTYLHRSQWAIHILYTLAPLVLVYELWAVLIAPRTNSPTLVAHNLLQSLLHTIGFSWAFMPGVVVALALIVLHTIQQRSSRHNYGAPQTFWIRPDGNLLGMMCTEAIAWAVPLFIIAAVWSSNPDPALTANTTITAIEAPSEMALLLEKLMLSIGAGVFEEVIFRFGIQMLIAGALYFVFQERELPRYALAIGTASALFALAHFAHSDSPIDWNRFCFFWVGGCYLGVIFCLRGLGIAVLAHVIYDIMVSVSGAA